MRGESIAVYRVILLTLTLAAGERGVVYGHLLPSGLRVHHVFSGLVGKGQRRKEEHEGSGIRPLHLPEQKAERPTTLDTRAGP